MPKRLESIGLRAASEGDEKRPFPFPDALAGGAEGMTVADGGAAPTTPAVVVLLLLLLLLFFTRGGGAATCTVTVGVEADAVATNDEPTLRIRSLSKNSLRFVAARFSCRSRRRISSARRSRPSRGIAARAALSIGNDLAPRMTFANSLSSRASTVASIFATSASSSEVLTRVGMTAKPSRPSASSSCCRSFACVVRRSPAAAAKAAAVSVSAFSSAVKRRAMAAACANTVGSGDASPSRSRHATAAAECRGALRAAARRAEHSASFS